MMRPADPGVAVEQKVRSLVCRNCLAAKKFPITAWFIKIIVYFQGCLFPFLFLESIVNFQYIFQLKF